MIGVVHPIRTTPDQTTMKVSNSVLQFTAVALVAASSLQAADNDEAGFEQLFNGKDLAGWKTNAPGWTVADAAISTFRAPGGYLIWQGGTVGDFELRFSFRLVSGIAKVQYHGRKIQTTNEANNIKAYTFEMVDLKTRGSETGLLYEDGGTSPDVAAGDKGRRKLSDLGKRTIRESTGKDVVVGDTEMTANEIRAGIRQGEWNEAVIRVEGFHIIHQLNGRVAVDVMDIQGGKQGASGTLGLRVISAGTVVHFKNIRLKRLP